MYFPAVLCWGARGCMTSYSLPKPLESRGAEPVAAGLSAIGSYPERGSGALVECPSLFTPYIWHDVSGDSI